MKHHGQGQKTYILRLNGSVSKLMTIAQALEGERYHKRFNYEDKKIEVLNIKDFMRGFYYD